MKIVGLIIAVVGGFLWFGNVLGFFPTFPLAGYLTIVVGSAIYKKG